MSENTQPDLQWGPLEQKPRGRGRVWLIVGLVVAALVIVGVLLFFLLPRGGGTPSATESPSPTPTASPTASPMPTSTATAVPTEQPVATEPPPVVDPSVDVFRSQVSAPLEDAGRGLDLVVSLSGQDALSVIDTLREDAQRLFDTLAPSSIAGSWEEGVTSYDQRLSELRSAESNGGSTGAAIDAARAAVQNLRNIVGL
ncbi:MAG: hypothetical protein AAGC61_00225 [Microbacterium sp.]